MSYLRNPFTSWATVLITGFLLIACQKEIKFKSGYAPISQVINSYFSPNKKLSVNISKSKHPSDLSPVEFLSNCQVDLYEDGIFKETLLFYLKDTLSGLGSYLSSFNLSANKTYKIISTHPELGIAEAEEFLPSSKPFTVELLQHADTAITSKTGNFKITFDDSLGIHDYYYLYIYYKFSREIIDTVVNDTTIKIEYNLNALATSTEIFNPSNHNRVFFSDENFDGQTKTFFFNFPSSYDKKYKTIDLIFDLSHVGYNFYEWNIQQLKPKQSNLNEGEEEPYNLRTNVKNGYGHFSGFASKYFTIKIK